MRNPMQAYGGMVSVRLTIPQLDALLDAASSMMLELDNQDGSAAASNIGRKRAVLGRAQNQLLTARREGRA